MSRTNNKCINMPIGEEFGLWTVKSLGHKWDYLLCECICGKEKNVNVYSLTSGKSKSCGCKSLALRAETQGLHNDDISEKDEKNAVRDINRKRRNK